MWCAFIRVSGVKACIRERKSPVGVMCFYKSGIG